MMRLIAGEEPGAITETATYSAADDPEQLKSHYASILVVLARIHAQTPAKARAILSGLEARTPARRLIAEDFMLSGQLLRLAAVLEDKDLDSTALFSWCDPCHLAGDVDPQVPGMAQALIAAAMAEPTRRAHSICETIAELARAKKLPEAWALRTMLTEADILDAADRYMVAIAELGDVEDAWRLFEELGDETASDCARDMADAFCRNGGWEEALSAWARCSEQMKPIILQSILIKAHAAGKDDLPTLFPILFREYREPELEEELEVERCRALPPSEALERSEDLSASLAKDRLLADLSVRFIEEGDTDSAWHALMSIEDLLTKGQALLDHARLRGRMSASQRMMLSLMFRPVDDPIITSSLLSEAAMLNLDHITNSQGLLRRALREALRIKDKDDLNLMLCVFVPAVRLVFGYNVVQEFVRTFDDPAYRLRAQFSLEFTILE